MKKYLSLIIVNVFVFIAVIIFCELSVRLLFPKIQIVGTDRGFIKDSVYYASAGLVPNSAGSSNGVRKQTDNNGFWKYSKTKKTGKRILYIGDSVTMGIGVESDSTFAGIINNEENVIVFNSALIGYSSSDYLNVVKKIIVDEGNRLGISRVSLFWCLNDIYDAYPDSTTPEMKPGGVFGEVFNLFKKNFKLFYFLKNSFTDRPKSYYRYDERFYEPENKNFKQALANLVSISGFLADSISFEVFLLPYEYQLREEEKFQLNPQKMLGDSLASHRIAIHDLTTVFKGPSDPEELYLYADGIHFSNEGHRLAANYIKHLLSSGAANN